MHKLGIYLRIRRGAPAVVLASFVLLGCKTTPEDGIPSDSAEAAALSLDIERGIAGTGLFLLYAAEELQMPDALEVARAAGRRLVKLAVRTDRGLYWPSDQNGRYSYRMPNFVHGTAGIGLFLTQLYRATHESIFRDSALAAARYLTSIADTTDAGKEGWWAPNATSGVTTGRMLHINAVAANSVGLTLTLVEETA